MNENLFRKESLEKISSPGQLNRYIRVAEPGAWIILASIVVLLLGALAWGVFGTIETVVPACIVKDEAGVVCYVAAQDAVAEGMAVRSEGMAAGVLCEVSAELAPASAEAALYLEGVSEGDLCRTARVELAGISAGVYPGEVVTERISPISFVLQ